jgi:tetratricopeptide (TPR) repeat protein
LLRFGRVSGDTFDRARKDIIDVASALGTDLETAAFSVGRALQSPTQGLRQLRALGVIFTQSQQHLIKSLEETGQVAKAQDIILQALEDRFSGAADAARNTLGGALDGLKNAFGDLFEATDEGAHAAADGINSLSTVISDPQFKASLQTVSGFLLEIAASLVKIAATSITGLQRIAQYVAGAQGAAGPKSGIDALFEKQSNLGASMENALKARDEAFGAADKKIQNDRIAKIRESLTEVQNQIRSALQGQGGPQGVGSRQASKPGGVSFVSDAQVQQEKDDALSASREKIDEVSITARKKNIEGVTKLLRDFDEQTQTSLEQINSDYNDTFLKLKELLDAGAISAQQFTDRLKDATLKYEEAIKIDPIDLNAIEAKKVVNKSLTSQQLAVQEFVGTIKEGLANLAQSGELTGKSIAKYLLAAFQSRLIYKAIENIGTALTKALSNSAGKGGVMGTIGTAVGAIFGHAAGGGSGSGARIVGEDGPEVLFDSGRVMNRRQLAFAMGGGGGGVSIGDTTIVVQGTSDPERTAAYVEARIQSNNRRQLEQISRLMKNNGLGGLR